MKKPILIIISFFALVAFSCSNESTEEPDMDALSLTNYIYKTYNVNNTPNTVINSTNYLIVDDKITSSTGVNLETLVQQTSNYNYVDGKIDEIQSFTNGVLTRIQSFNYNVNNDLIEYLSESINSQNQSSSYEMHLFNHTADTIFSSHTRSDDGINYDTDVADYKIVLDVNDNRTYLETYSYLNDDTQFETNTYDANSNLLNESKYSAYFIDQQILTYGNNYTSNLSENLFNRINEATFTRKHLMLLYHLQSSAVNNINAKSIAKNTLIAFESTWGNSFADFEILNTTDTDGNVIYSDFKTIIASNTFARFSQEYIFQ